MCRVVALRNPVTRNSVENKSRSTFDSFNTIHRTYLVLQTHPHLQLLFHPLIHQQNASSTSRCSCSSTKRSGTSGCRTTKDQRRTASDSAGQHDGHRPSASSSRPAPDAAAETAAKSRTLWPDGQYGRVSRASRKTHPQTKKFPLTVFLPHSGVAVGSSIGHAIGGFFGGGSGASTAVQDDAGQTNTAAAFPQDGAYNSSTNNTYGARSCEVDAKQFTQCLDEHQGNMQICGWYLEQLVCSSFFLPLVG